MNNKLYILAITAALSVVNGVILFYDATKTDKIFMGSSTIALCGIILIWEVYPYFIKK